jgi:hypothetical protein
MKKDYLFKNPKDPIAFIDKNGKENKLSVTDIGSEKSFGGDKMTDTSKGFVFQDNNKISFGVVKDDGSVEFLQPANKYWYGVAPDGKIYYIPPDGERYALPVEPTSDQ